MPRLLLCTLCDDVRVEVAGKHTLVGLFDTFNVVDFEQPLPTFRVFARIGLETAGTHPLLLSFETDAGDFRIESQSRLDARVPSEVSGLHESTFIATMNGLQIPRPGRYLVRLAVAGVDLGGCAFVARAMATPTLQ